MEDDEEEQKTPKTNGFGLGLASLQVGDLDRYDSNKTIQIFCIVYCEKKYLLI